MNTKKFKKIVGQEVQKIKKKEIETASGSFRPLAELLLEWYDRKLAEEEVKKYDKNN